MESQVINATEYRNVSLSLLNVSKTNPRRTFEDAALKELAESIRAQGVLSPLLVRPTTRSRQPVAMRSGRPSRRSSAGNRPSPMQLACAFLLRSARRSRYG